MTLLAVLLLPLLLLPVLACHADAPATPAPAPEVAAPPSAEAALAAMDGRAPVPLLPMMAAHQKEQMRDHLRVIEEITGSLAEEDWDGVEAAAARMGSSPQMAMTCEHMGAGADGFTEQALDFHARADGIAEAARTRDAAAVLRATQHTLQACTACHDQWRQEVLDAAAYEARTGSAGPHHP
ncbi:MAG: cytochrome c [Alphaproteobacteria bacterium]|nr:cytochrome c [Alphaproteobacteria bacterium]